MEDDQICVSYGDKIRVGPNLDGELAVKIENSAFGEAPRWLSINMSGYDRLQAIEELIGALNRLRDAEQ